jgi:hypothetical protein
MPASEFQYTPDEEPSDKVALLNNASVAALNCAIELDPACINVWAVLPSTRLPAAPVTHMPTCGAVAKVIDGLPVEPRLVTERMGTDTTAAPDEPVWVIAKVTAGFVAVVC